MRHIQGQFSSLLPWLRVSEFHEGVVVQKNGILQRSIAYHSLDAGSLDWHLIKRFFMCLGQGWTFFIEAQRIRAGFEPGFFITFAWQPHFLKNLASNMELNEEYFVSKTDAAIAMLSRNMFIAPLDNKQTLMYLHSSVSFNKREIHLPDSKAPLDKILPDSVLENSLTMKLGDYYIPIMKVNDFSGKTFKAILEGLYSAGLEYRLVTRYICLSGSKAKTMTQKTCVMVWDKYFFIAKRKAEGVRSIINNAGAACKEDAFNALESFQGILPGCCSANLKRLHSIPLLFLFYVILSLVFLYMRMYFMIIPITALCLFMLPLIVKHPGLIDNIMRNIKQKDVYIP